MVINMTFFSILETLFIGPLKMLFEVIFVTAHRFINNIGLSILALSLVMNILVLPLYRRADAMQEKARDTEAKLHDGIAHIKKTFSGDERMMILQTYYRQNHYKPTDALRGSISLFLEIPFFIAAYQYLSHLDVLSGASLGPITDLSAPDGLLMIGGVSINILPILMTLVNLVSSTLYLKGFPAKTKVQLYGIALFFFIFLYNSPSGLVFYWTLNNVFSLVKNIFYKLKNPKKMICFLCAAAGMVVLFFGVAVYDTVSFKRKVFVIGIGLLLLMPLLLAVTGKSTHFRKKEIEWKPDSRLFLMGSVFLTILIGLLIPSVFIAASPQEYVDITYFHNPLWYIVNSFCMAAGTFLIWMRVFYWLASPRGKVAFDRLVWILCGVTIVNYMFFGTDLGLISSTLQYENKVSFSSQQQLFNFLVLVVIAAFLYFCAHRWSHAVINVLIISNVALGAMSVWNLVTIKQSVDRVSVQQIAERDVPHFQLSKSGDEQNVIVIMLDRAMGEYIPYIFNERPELKEQFAGFTYYDNTISFGASTNFGTPPLFGGYEYTPVEMNKRNTEPLVLKHNEALKVMPVIFAENGYDVTVCDPPYANYQWIPDLSIYDDCTGVKTYITNGQFGDMTQKQATIDDTYRNFVFFSVMKSMPLFLQSTIYSDGRYYQIETPDFIIEDYTAQVIDGISKSSGMWRSFLDTYYVLVNLPNMTDITDDTKKTFLILTNNTTHDTMLLQEPEYTPAMMVDNTEYDENNADRFVLDGRELKMEVEEHMTHYQANMAAMIQLGKWFDYLRENGVYDNTRIILVSDHGSSENGFGIKQMENLIFDDGTGINKDVEIFYPLLMVKDFNSREFVTSDTFMTQADVPVLAMENLIANPVNPFTGKAINSDEKTLHDQFVTMSKDSKIDENNGTTYLPSGWASVKDSIWDQNNWTFYDEPIVLDKYAMP